MPQDSTGFKKIHWIPPANPDPAYPFAYKFILIRSIDELIQALMHETDVMSFDTETTGLDHEAIDFVGYSFCMDGRTAYYVPVNHNTFGLGEKAVELIYNKMRLTKKVYMFNMRYDIRVMEYYGFQDYLRKIEQCPEENRAKLYKQLCDKQFIKYDMSEINVHDVQVYVWLVDTSVKLPSLKSSEDHYLGWRGASFEETVGEATNFYYLTPEEAYVYAATDALGTFLIGEKLKGFYDDAATSGQLDILSLQPLARLEKELTVMDMDRLKDYSVELDKKIKACQEYCWKVAGWNFNLGSKKDQTQVFKELNINTGIKTATGKMSTSKDALAEAAKKLKDDDPLKKFMINLTDYASLTHQKSTYVDNFIEEASSSKVHPRKTKIWI